MEAAHAMERRRRRKKRDLSSVRAVKRGGPRYVCVCVCY